MVCTNRCGPSLTQVSLPDAHEQLVTYVELVRVEMSQESFRALEVLTEGKYTPDSLGLHSSSCCE